MRTPERRETASKDLFRSRDSGHQHGARAGELALRSPGGLWKKEIRDVYKWPGQRASAARGLWRGSRFKHTYNLATRSCCGVCGLRYPYYHIFCGEEFFSTTSVRSIIDDNGATASARSAAGAVQEASGCGHAKLVAMKPGESRALFFFPIFCFFPGRPHGARRKTSPFRPEAKR